MKDVLVLLLVLLLGFAALTPLLDAGLLTDDYRILRIVHDDYLADAGAGLTWANAKALGRLYLGLGDHRYDLYRPTSILTFGLDLLFFGTDSRAYMLTNLVCHLLSGALLFFVLRRLVPDAGRAVTALATLLFLTCPLQVEPLAWCASRGDAFSTLFGLAAVASRVARPRGWLAPVLLVAVSLTCKESALVWVGALGLLDLELLRREGADRTLVAWLRDWLRRSWPFAAVLVPYFAIRYALFGSLGATRYNQQGLETYLESGALWGRYARSLGRVLAPISSNLLPRGGAWWTLAIVSGTATVAQLALGVRGGLRRGCRARLALACGVLVVPFLLGVLVNEITPRLIHSRACYAGQVGFALLVVLGGAAAKGRIARFLPIVILLGFAAVLTPAGARLYADAYQRTQLTLESIRVPLREIGGDVDTVALLGYRDERYFGDAFDMRGAIVLAIQRPFMPRDYALLKVRGDDAAPETMVSLQDALGRGTGATAFYLMREADAGGLVCDLVSWPHVTRPGAALVLTAPPPGAILEPDPARPETLALTLAFETDGLDAAAFTLTLVGHSWKIGDFAVDAGAIETSREGSRRRYVLSLPGDAFRAALATLERRRPHGWVITAQDEAGVTLAQSEMRMILVEPLKR